MNTLVIAVLNLKNYIKKTNRGEYMSIRVKHPFKLNNSLSADGMFK